MKQTIFISILFILLLVPCLAQEKTFDESVLSDKGRQAYQTLLKIKLFAIGGIGDGGKTSEGEKAFDILLEDKEAVSAFKSLIKNGVIEAGMYGLFGLKMTDCDCFQQEYVDFKKSRTSENNKETFASQSGCEYTKVETNSGKELVIDYTVSEGFDPYAKWKKRLIEQRNNLKKPNPN